MGPRLSIVAGLLAGVIAAVVLLAGVVALAPEPETPSPSPVLPSPAASSASPTETATASPPSRSAPPNASVTPSASAAGQFHLGDLGGIVPDVAAAGLETILPGVDVTP